MSHDLRCEWSTTPPKQCRCQDCEGRKHGIQVVRQRTLNGFLETAIRVGEQPAEEKTSP